MQRALVRLAIGWVAISGLGACASAGAAIRPGPPTKLTFAPPPGMVLINRAVEIRLEYLDFPKGSSRNVRQENHATTEERYEPLPDGGFRVTTTLLEAISAKDNVVQPGGLSLVGIAIVHLIDKDGRFLGVENADEVLNTIRSRLTNPDMRRIVEPLLRPDYIAKPLEAAWRARFERCGKTIAPGATSYAVDDQPVDEIGPIRTILQERALGVFSTGPRNGLEFELQVGDAQADFSHSPGALDALLPYPEGTRTLTADVKGTGKRLVDANTCQVYNEELNITGEGNLNKRTIDPNRITLPLKVRYVVHRQVLRMTPAEAQSMGITTRVLTTPAVVPPAAPAN